MAAVSLRKHFKTTELVQKTDEFQCTECVGRGSVYIQKKYQTFLSCFLEEILGQTLRFNCCSYSTPH